ncbi:UbiD family decarboxylase [Candidatus Micrarchaeota archaeon CG10_big_fil_rev_8_21_14_0_10_45_29]|nr:MAG: UbiD family decarboxylase [Candidatus Micrarchaeota archaeon CG10_big_fil_rev_8_21_14_0_10_45_29]
MKSFRDFVWQLKEEGQLTELKKPISKNLDLAGALKELEGKAVFAHKIKENEGALVAGNIFCTKDLICKYYGIEKKELIPNLIKAIENPTTPKEIPAKEAPVLENTMEKVDLNKLPILFHAEKDGGPYFSSAVVISKDKELGQNCAFHRMMQIGKDKMVARILERHTNEFIKRNGGTLEVAIVIGAPINFLLASAISTKIGIDEAHIANSLMPLNVTKLHNGILVPADAEYVLEASITDEMHPEGPFIDLTETYDIVREQRIVKIKKIHHRDNPIYHALLPGALEHKILMGMPKEPTIFIEVNKVAKCTGVNITPGGCSWLHAVVQIKKKNEDEGKKAIEACFEGHKSLKHCVIVDDDINIYSPDEVEWAIATRAQADKDVIIKENQKGSSLDPSADPNTRHTAKAGIDATKPLVAHGKNFEKAGWKKIDVKKYM